MNQKIIRKLLRDPVLFARDALLKRRPLVLNEIGLPIQQEQMLIRLLDAQESRIENHLDVDVVFTWVDNTDPAWRARKDAALAKYQTESFGQHATDDARFSNHDELMYSIASIRRFMPWVRKIFIVTDQQRPNWLQDDTSIEVIDHSEIIEPEHLPTFNSHVIEACLYRIKGLSEHFIYFNDDVFAGRSLKKNHFFQSNGLASLFLTQKSLKKMMQRGVMTPTLGASLYSVELLKKYYGVTVDVPLIHTYVPQRRSVLELVASRHRDEIEAFKSNRFRGDRDLNIPTFLAPWTAYLEGKSAPAIDVCHYFNIRSSSAKSNWRQLLAIKSVGGPHSFCANDFHSTEKSDDSQDLRCWLDDYFSKK